MVMFSGTPLSLTEMKSHHLVLVILILASLGDSQLFLEKKRFK